MNYQVLGWDSDFFGVKVVRIAEPRLLARDLTTLLAELGAQHVKLAYWASDRQLDPTEIKLLGGTLVDTKQTFSMDFRRARVHAPPEGAMVVRYDPSMSIGEFEDLAVQSGEYSRFATDPRIPRAKFVGLYTMWMQRSLQKEMASEVLAIREAGRIVAAVTLGDKGGRGDIGLLAVDQAARGRKYGQSLVGAAQRWFVENGYRFGQVVTQAVNTPACNLYRKCGYSVEKVEYVYHFWL